MRNVELFFALLARVAFVCTSAFDKRTPFPLLALAFRHEWTLDADPNRAGLCFCFAVAIYGSRYRLKRLLLELRRQSDGSVSDF